MAIEITSSPAGDTDARRITERHARLFARGLDGLCAVIATIWRTTDHLAYD